ncbi:hypothetical protein [Rossellomorea aquimaris]|uniref:Uncharacterized protein n=1 Tax=Rossellomorea aquimaris TaxID=189382 RepID=A0A366ELY3_9BACI|nr:hypothetical protein [Rossellomorea aquimaris]RBP02996.1 hypothetical protein DET59_11193 [Rossellomorea aquimaris]
MMLVWGLILLLVVALFMMPKGLTVRENLIVFPFVGYFAAVAHVLVGLLLDYVDFGSTKSVEFSDFALVAFAPSLIALLFLNFMKQEKLLLYVIIWTIFSFLIELLLSFNGYMKHLEWKIWYSIPVYLLAFFLLHWFFQRIVRNGSQGS